MHAYWRLVWVLSLGFFFHLKSGAQEPMTQVTVRITAVKESDWQREMAKEGTPDELRGRLNARTLAELTGSVKNEGTTVLRSGEKKDVITEWKFDREKDQAVADTTVEEFIGTEVRLQQEPPKNHADATRISLTLIHDLSPLQLQSLPYANAAVGAEREKHQVTSPRYERLRWQGEVLVGVKERMIASLRPANDPGTRIVVFFKGSGGSTLAPSMEVRQTIYRVPELEMIEWVLQGRPADAALEDHLRKAVAAGKASIVSSATLALAPHADTAMQTGTEWSLPSEVDQIFDQLYLPPVAFQTALEGTRLKMNAAGGFQSFYAPRAPLAVQWPTSWLRARDAKGGNSKAIHGWMDWYDRFEQEVVGASLSATTSPQLVAMMPPADQVWGADRKGRWLDVTLMQLSGDVPKPSVQAAPQEPADPFAPPANPFTTGWAAQPPTMRSLFLGIAIDKGAAHALLKARQPGQDEALLSDLLARVKRGEARVFTSAYALHNTNRRTQTSARIHAFPQEMPSIPSAWENAFVGTLLEQDDHCQALTQDLAPPARTEWKLARDMPEAIMWQPRFRKMSVFSQTAASNSSGTHLMAALDVAAVMAGPDLPANETLLLFSRSERTGDASENLPPDVELETLIFEIPVNDADTWLEVPTADFEAFTQKQITSGRASLLSQTMLRTQPSFRFELTVVDEYMTAVEFDPPSREAPFRMRPTALKRLPVGLQLEGDLSNRAGDLVKATFYHLRRSVSKPVEPGLEETLQIASHANPRYPGAKHEVDEWSGTLSMLLGKYYSLGLSPPPGGGINTTRIAFVRLRPTK